LSRLGDGPYRFGVRANHLFLNRQSPADVEVISAVELAEISGSETFIHFALGQASWVAQEEGVHSLGLGAEVRIFLDPGNLFAFAMDDRLVVAPERDRPPMAAA
jgi:glycerol transport system ATP-binding protein